MSPIEMSLLSICVIFAKEEEAKKIGSEEKLPDAKITFHVCS